jgi:hypothetical protein
MRDIKELLQDADPLRHESTTSSEQRDAQRRAVLAAAFGARDRVGAARRSRATFFMIAASVVIVALFIGDRMWSPRVRQVNAAVRFEVRLAEDSSAPGLREAKVSGTDRSVYLHNEVIVTNGDIAAARVIHTGDAYKVGVEFNASGAEKIFEATRKHLGKPLAILIDDQVVMALVVRSPTYKSAEITGNFTAAEAERIVSGIIGAP